MKVCVSTLMPYQAPMPGGEPPADPLGPWPTPPTEFEPDLGVRSTSAELDLLQLADELGFDWVAVTEHHFLPRLSPAPMVLAGALSQRIRRARVAVLGPTLSILNPLKVAEEFATLDNLLAGRLVAGVLRGTPNELRAYNIPAEESRPRFEEGVELMLRAWTAAEPFAWHGRFFNFPVVSVWPGPIQKPHPPLLVSGKSPESAAFAARHHLPIGLSFETLDQARAAVERYRAAAAASTGWTPGPEDVLYRAYCYVADTDAAAESLAARSSFGHRSEPGGFFRGRPETVLAQIRAFHASAGVGTVDLIFNDNRGHGIELPYPAAEASLRLFAAEVLPHLHSL
jgi:alkanesulfonate monooxygenase SsuD/methylene tetrahydromethanopterin reductase-like flavin-dependent oxidoreductase (luciferase family)